MLAVEITEAFCGCCGTPSGWADEPWCADCGPHIGDSGPPCDRTFYAQTGTDCPWQVGA